MSDAQTPAGWYRDPSGEASYRWWDGSAWSSSTSPGPGMEQPSGSGHAPGAEQASGFGHAPGAGQASASAVPSMPPVAPYATGERPQLPPDRPIYGPFIWVITLLPIISILTSLSYQPHFRYQTIEPGVRTIDPLSIYTPAYLLVVGAGLVIYAATIVLAFRDQRWLEKQGVVRPFAWGWAFLQPVYVIGRSIVVNGVTRRHALWPIWIFIAIEVVGLAIGFSHTAGMVQQLPPR